MDPWDLTRLVFRRWYFALPVLLLTLVAVFVVGNVVQPEYKAIGHLQLVPPTHRTDKETAKPDRIVNPWFNLGIQALGQAAALKMQDQRVVQELASAGYAEKVVITIQHSSTYLVIEVNGSSPEQATNTVKRVMKLLIEEMQAEQQQFGVAREDLITTVPLDQGEKIVVVNGTVNRALIATGGLGVLLAAGFTIGLDALLLRRGRRRDMAAGVPAV